MLLVFVILGWIQVHKSFIEICFVQKFIINCGWETLAVGRLGLVSLDKLDCVQG